MVLTVDLLDALAARMGCQYLSDLPHMDRLQKMQMARELEHISVDAASLREWNDALEYLIGAPACADAEQARAALIAGLKG